MSDERDIVKALREDCVQLYKDDHADRVILIYEKERHAAADEIERLRAEVAEMTRRMMHVKTCDLICSHVGVGGIYEINFVFKDIEKMQEAFDALTPRDPSDPAAGHE